MPSTVANTVQGTVNAIIASLGQEQVCRLDWWRVVQGKIEQGLWWRAMQMVLDNRCDDDFVEQLLCVSESIAECAIDRGECGSDPEQEEILEQAKTHVGRGEYHLAMYLVLFANGVGSMVRIVAQAIAEAETK